MATNITITNGTGTAPILNGNYNVTSDVTGYDNNSITPSTVTIVAGTNNYDFTIAATGTLTVHVSEDGTQTGTPIVGATLIRTDASGTEYGTSITTNAQGNAVFENVPFSATGAPTVYFKQTASDGGHEFSSEVVSTTLTTQTSTYELTNLPPEVRTFTLTDSNYAGLTIASGQITLN